MRNLLLYQPGIIDEIYFCEDSINKSPKEIRRGAREKNKPISL